MEKFCNRTYSINEDIKETMHETRCIPLTTEVIATMLNLDEPNLEPTKSMALNSLIREEVKKVFKELKIGDLVSKEELNALIETSCICTVDRLFGKEIKPTRVLPIKKGKQPPKNEPTNKTADTTNVTAAGLKKFEKRMTNLEEQFQACMNDKADQHMKKMKLSRKCIKKKLRRLLTKEPTSLKGSAKTALGTGTEELEVPKVEPIKPPIEKEKKHKKKKLASAGKWVMKPKKVIETDDEFEPDEPIIRANYECRKQFIPKSSVSLTDIRKPNKVTEVKSEKIRRRKHKKDINPAPLTPNVILEEYRQFYANLLVYKDSLEVLKSNGQ